MDNKKTQSKKLSQEEKAELESFKKWLTDKKYSPKNLDEVKKYYAQYQKEKALASAQQAKKAAHGAKLNYFRTLKNQCPEGEELYYYKKGGSVGCGCKKKEDGGDITKALKGTAVEKFKNRKRTKAEQDRINKLSEEDYFAGTADHTKPGTKPRREEPEQPKVTRPKTSTVKKDSSKHIKSTIQKCGGPVEKFKKHFWGGKL